MNSKLFRGSLDTIILQLLTERGELYGYEIVKIVKEKTQGEFDITQGALYPALHRLEGKGLLDITHRTYSNRIRKYYKLTEKGKREVPQILAEMQEFINSLQNVFKPKLT